MSEEKKEEQKTSEAPKADAQQAAAPVAAAPAQAAAVKPEEKKVEPKKEKPANCISCKKSIKKKRWYYRNGNYYCTKRCWSSAVKKEKDAAKAKEEAAPAA